MASHLERVRLFRADTPHDVAGACLIAGLSPARDYLAISADKAAADPAEYLLVMRAMARAHRWTDVIDITGLPINEHNWLKQSARSSRLQRYRDMRRSFELLRASIGSHVPPDAVNDLFLTCFDHPDTQLASQVMPDAEISYLPHGLGSMHAAENETCVRWTAKASPSRRARHLLAKLLKRGIWGPAATPPLSFDVAGAYSFYRPPAIGRQRYDLAYLMTPEVMRRMFLALSQDIRGTYESLESGGDGGVGLLLMGPSDATRRQDYPYDLELRGLAELAAKLVRTHDVKALVVKPHPRSTGRWTTKVAEGVRSAVPDTSVTVITRHSGVPIEVAASVMNVVAAAGIGSTSVHTMARIYGIPTYSSDRLLRELHAGNPRITGRIEAWISDNSDFYTRA